MPEKPDVSKLGAVEILKELLAAPYHLGDFIYDVREREGKGWDGPKVTRFSELCERARLLTSL